VIPRGCRVDLDDLVARKRCWIERRVGEMLRTRAVIADGYLLYRGETFEVRCLPPGTSGEGVSLAGRTCTVHASDASRKDRLLRSFLTRDTLHYAEERLLDLARETGLKHRALTTRDMVKWGYCSRDGILCFNWRLICLPPRLANYVIVHELMHLKHFDHSPRFRAAVAEHLPDYKELEASLRTYVPK
jgi:predicted metal-dependent hydrolase